MTLKTIVTSTATTAVAALLAGPAFAQANIPAGDPNEPSVISDTHRASSLADVPLVPSGFAVQAGGGATAFSRHGARNEFGTGGYWDARAVLGSRSFLGAELAYVGSARDIKAAGVSDDAALVGNGAEAVARANLPLSVGALRVEPFLFGGVGWTYYQVVKSDINTSGIKDHANAFVVPFGTGVSAAYSHFIVDARFTYRAVVDDKLVPTNGSDHLDLQNWSAGLTVGYEL
jgi:hypothetical protein